METNTTNAGTGVALGWDEPSLRRWRRRMIFGVPLLVLSLPLVLTLLRLFLLPSARLLDKGILALASVLFCLALLGGLPAGREWKRHWKARGTPLFFVNRHGLLDLRPDGHGFLAWNAIRTLRASTQLGNRYLTIVPRDRSTFLSGFPEARQRRLRRRLPATGGSLTVVYGAGPPDDVLNARIADFQREALAATARPEDSDAASVATTLPERPPPSSAAAARTRRR